MPEKEAGGIDGKHNAADQCQYKDSVHLLAAVPARRKSGLYRRRQHHARVGGNDHQCGKITEQIQMRVLPVRPLQPLLHFFHR